MFSLLMQIHQPFVAILFFISFAFDFGANVWMLCSKKKSFLMQIHRAFVAIFFVLLKKLALLPTISGVATDSIMQTDGA